MLDNIRPAWWLVLGGMVVPVFSDQGLIFICLLGGQLFWKVNDLIGLPPQLAYIISYCVVASVVQRSSPALYLVVDLASYKPPTV